MSETILIVNDEPSQLRMAEFAIRDKLHYCTVAITGCAEAIRWVVSCRQPHPDLILLDLMMPKTGELGVIRQVKAFRPRLPIIVLTQYGDQENASRAIQAGAYDFLQKPVALERLKLSIQHALTMQRLASYIEQMEGPGNGLAASADAAGEWWFLDAKGRVRTLKTLEKEAVRFALQHTEGSMSRAARNLGIGRSTLYRKVTEFGLDDYISRANQATRQPPAR